MTTPLRNIELKAGCADLDRARRVVEALGAAFQQRQVQIDTYFRLASGRLKLRQIGTDRAELIWYDRPDQAQFRQSNYRIAKVVDAQTLLAVLSAACGVRGEVRKVRDILLFHNVRIHLDRVEGLGSFVEFEAVIAGPDDEAASPRRLDELHRALDIRPEDHCSASYSDMLGI